MAILQLVDQLADMLNQGWQVPLSHYRMVDAGEFGKMLERMRITVPSSIKESERTLADRDAILATAQQEAERIVYEAHQQAMELAARETIVEMARREGDRIVEESRRIAHQHINEADAYTAEVLGSMRQHLHHALQQVENGLQVMQEPDLPPAQHFPEPVVDAAFNEHQEEPPSESSKS